MQFSFDLISDLHVDTWPNGFDWTGQPTSTYCVVAGDVAADRKTLRSALKHLGRCYHAVFYVDGNDEHANTIEDLGESYRSLVRDIGNIPNVVYLQDNVVIINGVALLGTNGWWGYDFDPALDLDQCQAWHREKYLMRQEHVDAIAAMSRQDANYMRRSVAKLQTHKDVAAIVVVTHTVPTVDVINHDIDLVDTWRYNVMGNTDMQSVHQSDTEEKIHTWCFGHYHKSMDRSVNGVRYVSNCKGRGGTLWSQSVYHPKRITIEY